MNIVVYDIAAAGGGGVTILNQYIEKAREDSNNQWWFILSLPGYEECSNSNIHVLYQKELDIKGLKRWMRRFLFEHFKIPKILSEIKPDRVFSLQNMTMPKAKCSQTVYLHQSLQFAPVKFSFTKKEERSLAIRQKVICGLIRKNLQKADTIIVQTRWMKKATAKWVGIDEKRILIEPPHISDLSIYRSEQAVRDSSLFFYPASEHVYKNHKTIIEACKVLKRAGIYDYHIEFTLDPSESAVVKKLYDEVQREQLPISFIGYQDRAAMRKKYMKCTLLFPSYIETFGLPLLEAQTLDAYIIASDCEYAHDVLGDYQSCRYVAWNDPVAWAEAIKETIKN